MIILTFWIGRRGRLDLDVMSEQEFLDNYDIPVSYSEWLASGGELAEYAKTFDQKTDALTFLRQQLDGGQIDNRKYQTIADRIWRAC